MDFENKVPEWKATGVEPPTELKSKGFESGYKPPAAYFNWFWNRVSACLSELFSKLKSHAESTDNPHNTTPEQIGAAKEVHSHMYDEAVTTAGTGAEYTAEVTGMTELKVGLSFNMVPHVASTTTTPTLNVNGLGAKVIRRRLSGSMTATTIGGTENWIAAGKPVYMTYDGTFWIADVAQPNSADLYGILPVAKGGTGASTPAQALVNLGALPKAGGTMTGPLILTEGVHYGTEEQMPAPGTAGRIFFMVVKE